MFEELALPANAAIYAVAAVVVWGAGTRLAGYADRIAEATGLGRALLGMLLLAWVTSLPELAVAVSATVTGAPALGVSNALGGTAVNVVILAIADAVYGREALTSTPGTPHVMLQGALGIVLLSLVVAAVTTGDVLFWGVGAWSWSIVAAYIGSVWLLSKSQGLKSWQPARQPAPAPSSDAGEHRRDAPLAPLLWRTAGAASAILLGGFVLARTADALAEQTGLGSNFFGAVLLGPGTRRSAARGIPSRPDRASRCPASRVVRLAQPTPGASNGQAFT